MSRPLPDYFTEAVDAHYDAAYDVGAAGPGPSKVESDLAVAAEAALHAAARRLAREEWEAGFEVAVLYESGDSEVRIDNPWPPEEDKTDEE